MKKNELSLLEQSISRTEVNSSQLVNAVNLHIGGGHITTKQDSEGNDYISATFALKAPTKNRTEIVVNDVKVAESIERMTKDIALGEVSLFALAKEISNFADSDATSLGFDSTVEMVQSLFELGKSTVSNYRRVGKYFINDDFTLRGAIPQECTISLLNQLLSFVKWEDEAGQADIRNVECLFKYGIITPYMKQKDYKKIISALGTIETEKELKDMDDLEIESFKTELKNKLNPPKQETKDDSKQETKDDSKQETKDDSKQETKDNAPRTKEIVIGESMSMVQKLEENFKDLEQWVNLQDDTKILLGTWIDNLYTTLADMLND